LVLLAEGTEIKTSFVKVRFSVLFVSWVRDVSIASGFDVFTAECVVLQTLLLNLN